MEQKRERERESVGRVLVKEGKTNYTCANETLAAARSRRI
jgi:hypothetical protein